MMRPSFFLSVFSVVVFLSACLSEQSRTSQEIESATTGWADTNSWIHKAIHSVQTETPFNGIVVVIRGDQEPERVVQGYRDPLKREIPLKPEDRFHVSSLSKLFTAFAVFQLMEQHGLQPTDPIGPYFPELHPALGKVTIQQLANHTNGIHDYLSLTDQHDGITNDQALALLMPLDTTVFEPGTHWGYSNSGYVLLGMLIERISGEPFDEYMEREVLQPLGMKTADIRPPKNTYLNGFFRTEANTSYSRTRGDAGLCVSASDLIAFYQNQAVMKPYMQQARDLASPWKEPPWTYGFGWYFNEDSLGAFRAHSGRSQGFQSYLRMQDDPKGILFILMNQSAGSINPWRDSLTAAWAEHIEP